VLLVVLSLIGSLAPARAQERLWGTIGIHDGLPGDEIHAIFFDREDNFWIATSKGLALRSKVNPRTSPASRPQIRVLAEKDGLPAAPVHAIAPDREGRLWFGTLGGGVSRNDGQSFQTFTTKDGLANDDVQAIAPDREGRLWFGTWGGGVSQYDGQTFRTFTTKDGLASDDVQAILQDRDGKMWLGTLAGVSSWAATEVAGSLSRFILALTFDPRQISYGLPRREVLWSYRLDNQAVWSEPSRWGLLPLDY
jgi:ligand-binding sensor domain-containing protein